MLGLPLIHDKTMDEWGAAVLRYFMTGTPVSVSHSSTIKLWMNGAQPSFVIHDRDTCLVSHSSTIKLWMNGAQLSFVIHERDTRARG